MHPEAEAEVILTKGAAIPASPVASFGFITTFGNESFSAAVIPDGTAHLVLHEPKRVRLRFLVEAAAKVLRSNASFTFFEQGREGNGCILSARL